jgi:hypothetical protein
MALELRPNCECCDRDLPPASPLARICTYECTFCSNCVEDLPAPSDRQLNVDPDFRFRNVRR